METRDIAIANAVTFIVIAVSMACVDGDVAVAGAGARCSRLAGWTKPALLVKLSENGSFSEPSSDGTQR
jgi:hypothetical protein